MEWQPIETAPKDGSEILTLTPIGHHKISHWNTDRYVKNPRPYWQHEDCLGKQYHRNNQPTHWMPLPAPPKE